MGQIAVERERTDDKTTSTRSTGTGDRAWDAFVGFLRRGRYRVTQARHYVLDHVKQRDDHFLADQVAADLANGPQRVSRGTVYHSLALLVKAGMVREVRDTDTHVHYEWCFGVRHHEHMVCDRCGRFVEFTSRILADHLDELCAARNFRARTHQVMVYGICARCLAADEPAAGGDEAGKP